MKYERLTERDEFNNADIIGLATEKLFGELCFDETNLLTTALNRLAELEDKIERGELVDVKENHLIAISRASGKSSKQLKAIEILTKYENGMLVSIPFIRKHPKIDNAYMVVYENEYGDLFGKMYCGENAQAEAEAKLKELENEISFN